MSLEKTFSEFTKGLEEIESEFTRSEFGKDIFASFDGEKYPVLSTTNELTQELAIGGVLEDYKLTLTFRKFKDSESLDPMFKKAIPKVNDRIVYGRKDYRVVMVETSENSPIIQVALGSTSK